MSASPRKLILGTKAFGSVCASPQLLFALLSATSQAALRAQRTACKPCHAGCAHASVIRSQCHLNEYTNFLSMLCVPEKSCARIRWRVVRKHGLLDACEGKYWDSTWCRQPNLHVNMEVRNLECEQEANARHDVRDLGATHQRMKTWKELHSITYLCLC